MAGKCDSNLFVSLPHFLIGSAEGEGAENR